MFVNIETFDRNKFYINRPICFQCEKVNNDRPTYGLIHSLEFRRLEVIYSTGKRDHESIWIDLEDIKDGIVDFELLGKVL